MISTVTIMYVPTKLDYLLGIILPAQHRGQTLELNKNQINNSFIMLNEILNCNFLQLSKRK